MNDNEYAMAGWLAIAAAVITFPMVALGFVIDIIKQPAPEVAPILGIAYLVLVVSHTGFGVYAFLRFRHLLNKRHSFHDVDGLITVIVIGVLVMTAITVPAKMLSSMNIIGKDDLPVILAFVAFLLLMALTMSVLSVIFAVRLLRLESNLNGFLKPYVIVTIAAAACFALFITAPLGFLLDAAGNIILAMIFLKAPAGERIPEFV